MMSQPDFDKACKLLKQRLGDLGWPGISIDDLDGGFTKEFNLRANPDEDLGKFAITAAITAKIFVSRKSLVIDPVNKNEMDAWLRRKFPMLVPGNSSSQATGGETAKAEA